MEKDMYERELERFMNGTQDTVKLCRNTPDGDMTVSACYILPGIFLALNDIHMQTVPCNREGLPSDLLIMNYCLQGRCEFKLDDDSYNYIDYLHISKNIYVLLQSYNREENIIYCNVGYSNRFP